MHFAFVVPRFYPYRGGYENSLLALSRQLVERGHRVTVYATVADDLEAFWLPGFRTFPEEQITVDGIAVRRFPIGYNRMRRRASRLLGMLPYWRWKAQFWRPSFIIPGLQQALRTLDADLFHIGPLPYTNLMYAGLQAAEARNVPVVATPCVHLGEQGNDEVARHYVQPYQLNLLQHSSRIFCMTNIELQMLDRLGVKAEKVVAPHGIDITLASGGNPGYLRERYGVDGPVVLHLAVKTFEKGSITLMEAMRDVWGRGSNAWLVMAGPTLSDFTRYLAAHPAPGARFLNLPAFADQEKRDLLASATVVAQPSRVESLGLVMLEAWANSKPVIAADIAVSRQLVTDAGGGVASRFGDQASLAAEIMRMLDNPERAQTMGRSGQQNAVSEYGSDKVWPHLAGQLEQVVSARGKSRHRKD